VRVILWLQGEALDLYCCLVKLRPLAAGSTPIVEADGQFKNMNLPPTLSDFEVKRLCSSKEDKCCYQERTDNPSSGLFVSDSDSKQRTHLTVSTCPLTSQFVFISKCQFSISTHLYTPLVLSMVLVSKIADFQRL